MDHFSENEKHKPNHTSLFLFGRKPICQRCCVIHNKPTNRLFFASSLRRRSDEEVGGPRRSTVERFILSAVEHGSHNVSRWMTWLPISLKNAAKCDKWYQLQNHPITESLNAKGAREKPSKGDPRACRIAQCRTKTTHPLCKAIWIGSSWVEMK